MNNKKVKNKPKIFKIISLILLLILSYVCSLHFNGYEKTNIRFLNLIALALIGFFSFYIVYYIICFIIFIKYKILQKIESKNVVNCDDKVNDFLKDEKYKFTYNVKIPVQENLSNAVTLAKNVVLDVATLNKKNNKYFYLNYSVYDALEIYGNLVTFAYDKIDGVFKTFKIQNKPITIIEKSLQKVIEDENIENTENKQGLLSKIKKGVGNVVLNTSIFLFKNKIQDAVNEIIALVCLESFKIYGKRVKNKTQALDQEIEVQNA